MRAETALYMWNASNINDWLNVWNRTLFKLSTFRAYPEPCTLPGKLHLAWWWRVQMHSNGTRGIWFWLPRCFLASPDGRCQHIPCITVSTACCYKLTQLIIKLNLTLKDEFSRTMITCWNVMMSPGNKLMLHSIIFTEPDIIYHFGVVFDMELEMRVVGSGRWGYYT